MTSPLSLELTLFVEHGREREAANFYVMAFGARETATYPRTGTLMAVDLELAGLKVSVAGANPNREREPWRGGPFFPKAAGAVGTVFRLTVENIETTMSAATTAGAMVRDAIQPDETGRRVAALFDPFGHIWALAEQAGSAARLAA
ncbi:Glyoxalase-like domain protein [bacterium YEK0313]|nr:Glyoxalase-like domain protein [bacterium YEK0313]